MLRAYKKTILQLAFLRLLRKKNIEYVVYNLRLTFRSTSGLIYLCFYSETIVNASKSNCCDTVHFLNANTPARLIGCLVNVGLISYAFSQQLLED